MKMQVLGQGQDSGPTPQPVVDRWPQKDCNLCTGWIYYLDQRQARLLHQTHLVTAGSERDGTTLPHPKMLQGMGLTLTLPNLTPGSHWELRTAAEGRPSPTPPTGPVTTPAGEWQQRQGQSGEEEARWDPVTKGEAVSSSEPFPERCEGTEPCISWDSKPPAHALCPICLHLENTNSKMKLLRISSRIIQIRNSFLIWHKSLSAKITWTGLKISF